MSGMQRRRCLHAGLACAIGAAGSAVFARPALDPLERPALRLKRPAGTRLAGLAAAGRRLVAVGERGAVLLSDDEGRQWRQASQVPVAVSLTTVAFADAMHGYCAGHSGVLLATADAGETWQRRFDGADFAQRQLEAAGPQSAFNQLVADGPDKPWLALHFADPLRGLVVGAYNLALRTADGGHTWQPIGHRIDNPQGLHLYAAASSGENWLLAGEQGLLLWSTDAGRSFIRRPSPYKGSFFTALATADGGWLVAGLRGNVWRSVRQSGAWERVDGLPDDSLLAARRLADGRPLLVGQSGRLYVGDRLASRFDATGPVLPPATLEVLEHEGALVVAGLHGVMRHGPLESRV